MSQIPPQQVGDLAAAHRRDLVRDLDAARSAARRWRSRAHAVHLRMARPMPRRERALPEPRLSRPEIPAT